MNLIIDRNRLCALLEQASPCDPPERSGYKGDVSDYLIRHYLLPFLCGSQPTVNDLDFSQFTLDDVEDLKSYLHFLNETGAKLINMMLFFSDSTPLPLVGQRAFC